MKQYAHIADVESVILDHMHKTPHEGVIEEFRNALIDVFIHKLPTLGQLYAEPHPLLNAIERMQARKKTPETPHIRELKRAYKLVLRELHYKKTKSTLPAIDAEGDLGVDHTEQAPIEELPTPVLPEIALDLPAHEPPKQQRKVRTPKTKPIKETQATLRVVPKTAKVVLRESLTIIPKWGPNELRSPQSMRKALETRPLEPLSRGSIHSFEAIEQVRNWYIAHFDLIEHITNGLIESGIARKYGKVQILRELADTIKELQHRVAGLHPMDLKVQEQSPAHRNLYKGCLHVRIQLMSILQRITA